MAQNFAQRYSLIIYKLPIKTYELGKYPPFCLISQYNCIRNGLILAVPFLIQNRAKFCIAVIKEWQRWPFLNTLFSLCSHSLFLGKIRIAIPYRAFLIRKTECIFKWSLLLNALPHLEQANGFSPVWKLSCVLNSTHFEQ